STPFPYTTLFRFNRVGSLDGARTFFRILHLPIPEEVQGQAPNRASWGPGPGVPGRANGSAAELLYGISVGDHNGVSRENAERGMVRSQQRLDGFDVPLDRH